MRPALLVLNGPVSDAGAVKRRAAAAGFVVCADGGAKVAQKLGIQPRVVIGDFDSLPKPLPRWKGTTWLFDGDEDLSDFEKALRFLAEGGAGAVWVVGLWGGRPDHQLVNLAVFERWSRTLSLAAVDPGWTVVAGKGRHKVSCPVGATVSLIPTGSAAVVSAGGVEYPLRRTRLTRSSRGLSNRASATPVELEVHSGAVWLALPG
ncbi:MAG: thiamine pyrophosphokinase [Elusimicrobia bacterium]|nr:MAG: thiamine pyrophosphokinase [Elusimicrobiota bacterium]